MQNPTRLFDCLEYQMGRQPLDDMLAAKEGGQWKKYSTVQVNEIVDTFSAGLIAMGIGPGDRSHEGRDKIAVIAKNRPEWVMLDLAVQQIGAVLTPIYPTISINELEFVLSDAAVKMVFVNDEELFLKVSSLRSKLPALQSIFTFEHVANARHWKEVLQASTEDEQAKLAPLRNAVDPEDLVTIIYTSGTTGVPKGVMLSHRNIMSNTMAAMPYFPPGDRMRALSFLPLNHIFERVVTYLYAFKGTSIYYAESLETIGDNLKEVKPHLFTTVPRLLEKVYDKIMAKGGQLTGAARKLFFWAHGLAEKFEINQRLPLGYRIQLALANKIIFKKWREALGGNVKCIVTGGAACQVRLIRIFTAAKLVVMEGYGLTETSPVISVNRYEESGRAFGTVGPLIDHVEVKLEEDGEILCKGPNVMMGYYKRPDLTAEVMKGEWFCTGDIGVFSKEGYLKITDRKKELFKTSGGKYVAPLPIESKLKESPFVEQVMIVGSERKFVGALIVPAFPNLQEWAYKQGIQENDPEKLIRLEAVKELFRELVESFNKFFNHVEQVKRFELLSKEWSVDTGEMTPKLSVKRKVILEKYKDAVERIYQ
ncbi:MAG: AMP-dependent synthetase/ligase [Bacteroidota bacterium]